MKLDPKLFKVVLAVIAAGVGAALQYGLVPPEFVPVVGMVSTFLAGLVRPPVKDEP